MPSWRGNDGKKLVIALCRDTIDETQKGAPAHLRVGFGKVWWLEGSTNSDTCNALRGAVHSLPLGVLDFTLDWHHETPVKQPKVDDVNVTADLLKPPSVRPKPVMDALEALEHLEDIIFAGRNGGQLDDFRMQAAHCRRVVVPLADLQQISSGKNVFHDEQICSQKGCGVSEALLCLGFEVWGLGAHSHARNTNSSRERKRERDRERERERSTREHLAL